MSLQLSQITHQFGSTKAVDSISLDVKSGEQVALIGPSGCGKTTLLRIMGTQLLPSAGDISLIGSSPTTLSAR